MKSAKMTKSFLKILSVFLSTVIVAFIFPALPAKATTLPATEYNKEIALSADKISQKYNIDITYPIRTDGYAAVGIPSLVALDQSLGYLSVGFVRQLSDYYAKNYSGKLLVNFAYLPENDNDYENAKLGKFDSKTSTITLYIPTLNKNMTISGCSPLTILHEMGHAYYLVVMNTYGTDAFKGSWVNYNYNLPYGTYKSGQLNKNIFASTYGATSFEEDFAEVFSYAFGCNRSGLGIRQYAYSANNTLTGLGKKINFLQQSITKMFKSSKEIIKGINASYKAKASINYGGLVLSGNSLEYIGFYQPHGVIDNILVKLKIIPVSFNWVAEIGGWKVWDNAGGIYVVFPGAEYATIKRPFKNVG